VRNLDNTFTQSKFTMLYNEIPSLDLVDFLSEDPKLKNDFVQNLGKAYEEIGFVAIKNHGLSDDLSAKLYDNFQSFFSQEDSIKQHYEIAGLSGQRGYIGKGKEHAKGRSIGDLKEFFHVGQIVQDNDPIIHEYPENAWVKEVPEFKENITLAYKTLENTGKNVLRAIALYLNLDEFYFEAKVHNGNSILRAIHYYPLNPETTHPDAVRAAEHGDINLITLLMGASADGLQVLRRDGKWIPITALPEQIIVNVGDMLERLTNDKLKSTIHRVVNPPKELMNTPRYSIPFFMHPRMSMDLSCLPECISLENPKKHDDISAGDFLMQRLQEIGLAKK
jgi:isopenicillin N synthase-like dioxygenase